MLSSRIARRFKGPCFSLFRRKRRFVIPTVDRKSLTLRCRPKLPELAMAAAESFLDLLGLGTFGACRGPSERRRCRAYRGRRLMAFRLKTSLILPANQQRSGKGRGFQIIVSTAIDNL